MMHLDPFTLRHTEDTHTQDTHSSNTRHVNRQPIQHIYIQRADANLAEWQASLREGEEGKTRDEGVFQGVYSADLKPPPFSDDAQCSHGFSEEGRQANGIEY